MRNTQTPRTDAAETNWWSEDGLRSAFIVRAEFARELEREMEQLRKERDEARRLVCELQCDPPERFIGLPHELAQMYGWNCFDVTERRQPDATTDKTSQDKGSA